MLDGDLLRLGVDLVDDALGESWANPGAMAGSILKLTPFFGGRATTGGGCHLADNCDRRVAL